MRVLWYGLGVVGAILGRDFSAGLSSLQAHFHQAEQDAAMSQNP